MITEVKIVHTIKKNKKTGIIEHTKDCNIKSNSKAAEIEMDELEETLCEEDYDYLLTVLEKRDIQQMKMAKKRREARERRETEEEDEDEDDSRDLTLLPGTEVFIGEKKILEVPPEEHEADSDEDEA